ncbi:putative PHD type zinc finger protein with BAH domain-containing protein [Umbelopsis nana]
MTDHKSSVISRATLNDGTTVQVNDHVYLAPEHLGEPFYIGRIMEFTNSTKRRGLQARIAWYNRPKDVVNRKANDPCLLIATMHSDLNPVSSIRGKCRVVHKDYIDKNELEKYRSQPDNFYYHQLYDRYIQRVYDVVPCEAVQNVPKDIQEALIDHYQFIVVEQGKAAELTDTRRVCCVCHDWCASRKPSKGFAWQCAVCFKKDPRNTSLPTPSLHKEKEKRSTSPAAANSQSPANSDKTDIISSQPTKPTSTIKIRPIQTRTTRSQTESRTGTPSRPTSPPPSSHKLASNDADDRIYPRARSRIGPKYQATVAEWDPETESEVIDPLQIRPNAEEPLTRTLNRQASRGRRKRPRGSDRKDASGSPTSQTSDVKLEVPDKQDDFDQLDSQYSRGGPETVTPYFDRPPNVTDEQGKLDRYMEQVAALPNLPLPSYSADFLDRALLELQQNDFDTEKALENVSHLTREDFDHLEEWTPEDIAAFENGIRAYGHELHSVASKVPKRSMAQIVRFFYKWKKTDRYEPVYSEWTKIYKPNKKFRRRGLSVPDVVSADASSTELSDSESDEEDESKEDPTIVSAKGSVGYECMNCGIDESDVWRRAPGDTDKRRKLHRYVLCDDCGVHWLKYGIMKPVNDTMGGRRGRGRPAANFVDAAATKTLGKRKRLMEASTRRKMWGDGRKRVRTPTPPPPSHCSVCNIMSPEAKLLTCKDCGLSVHSDCYGAIIPSNPTKWSCDACTNTKTPTVSTTYKCVLCSESREHPRQALKKTSGYNWAHVICSLFIPEVKYASTTLLSPVECIDRIHNSAWRQTCTVCQVHTGACVACAECRKPVHVRCAQTSDFHVGFEMIPVKADNHNPKAILSGLFKDKNLHGTMVPSVWCKEHDVSRKRIVQLTDRDVHNRSAITLYINSYKESEATSTGAMRKSNLISTASDNTDGYGSPPVPSLADSTKINSLRVVLRTANSRKPASQWPVVTEAPKHHCISCGIQRSPIWWSTHDVKLKKQNVEDDKDTDIKMEDGGNGSLDMDSENADQKLCHRCYFVS